MKVTRLDTLRLDEFPNLLFVRLHTDVGPVGLGETFFGAQAVEAYVHESVAPYLLGEDPREIERHARALESYVGYQGSGAEMRGNSAVDIALWDLSARASGQPLHQALGGRSRASIRTYNTCAGYRYVRARPVQAVENWGLPGGDAEGPYEDLDAFLERPGELALSLLEEGITGMKIWPFDAYAEASGGTYISNSDLDEGLEPFRGIRAAVGSSIDVMVELHALWDAPTAKRICAALEEFEPYWIEDPVRADRLDALASVTSSTRVPIAGGETVAGLAWFRQLLERRAVDMLIVDPGWCGGLTRARKAAAIADTFGVPVAPHDCTGPVGLAACSQLSLHAPNALVQETVRAFYSSWYRELATGLPDVAEGSVRVADADGHGVELLPGLDERPDARLRSSAA